MGRGGIADRLSDAKRLAMRTIYMTCCNIKNQYVMELIQYIYIDFVKMCECKKRTVGQSAQMAGWADAYDGLCVVVAPYGIMFGCQFPPFFIYQYGHNYA